MSRFPFCNGSPQERCHRYPRDRLGVHSKMNGQEAPERSFPIASGGAQRMTNIKQPNIWQIKYFGHSQNPCNLLEDERGQHVLFVPQKVVHSPLQKPFSQSCFKKRGFIFNLLWENNLQLFQDFMRENSTQQMGMET